jgi:hypothetical protein
MLEVSLGLHIFFCLLVLLVSSFWLAGMLRATRNEAQEQKLALMRNSLLMLCVWLALTAIAALSGWLGDFAARPPRLPLLLVPIALATTWLAFSKYGTALIKNISIKWLIGFQVFRFPLEHLLHWLYEQDVVPVQMTYSGYNYDIYTGYVAALVLLRSSNHPLPRWFIWSFNVIGLVLLINIVTIALLSAPLPFRQFFNEPANTFVAYWPWVWLPTFLVQAAWFGHLLVFRWLRRN